MDQHEPRLTAREKATVTWLIARMAKRGLADDRMNGGLVNQSDLERKVERVIDGARRRQEQQDKARR